jgi:hypothetical protein
LNEFILDQRVCFKYKSGCPEYNQPPDTRQPNITHKKPVAGIEPAPERPGPPQAPHTYAHNQYGMETITERFTLAVPRPIPEVRGSEGLASNLV